MLDNLIYSLYRITNTINGKSYIGLTKDLQNRFSSHCCNKKSLIGRAIRKYGKEYFKFEELCKGSKEYISDMEVKAITVFDTKVPCGYNLAEGGYTSTGWELSEATKLKYSGVNSLNAKLTTEDLNFILDNDHITSSELSIKYEVTDSVISQVRNGNTYKNHPRAGGKDYKKASARQASLRHRGELSPKSKLTEQDVIAIINDTDLPASDAARKFGCSVETIFSIRNNRCWKHIHRPSGLVYKSGLHSRNGRRYSESQVFEILSSVDISAKDLSIKFNTSPSKIYDIRNGRSYKDFYQKYQELNRSK